MNLPVDPASVSDIKNDLIRARSDCPDNVAHNQWNVKDFDITETLNYHLPISGTPKPQEWCHIRYVILDCVANNVNHLLLSGSTIQRQQLDRNANRLLLLFSVVFTLNIAFGNASLQYVSINFNQIVRSLVPVLTMWLSMFFLGKVVTKNRQFAVLPVALGVAMACYGDSRVNYSPTGVFYTVIGTLLASIKVVASGEMLTNKSIKLHPVDLLDRMAPLAFLQCMALAISTGEINFIFQRWNRDFIPFVTKLPVIVIATSGVLAFTLNITALQAYRVTSPLTCCIVAAVKQVLTILLGTILFHTQVTLMNATGILVVLIASTTYSYIAFVESSTSLTPVPHSNTAKSSLSLEYDDDNGNLSLTDDETVNLMYSEQFDERNHEERNDDAELLHPTKASSGIALTNLGGRRR